MLKIWREDVKRIPNIDANWIVIWVSIFCGFLLLDVFFPGWFGTSLLKYMGILLCVVYAYTKYNSDIMLSLALLFTFMADTILVWTEWTVAGCIFSGSAKLNLNIYSHGRHLFLSCSLSLLFKDANQFMLLLASTVLSFLAIYTLQQTAFLVTKMILGHAVLFTASSRSSVATFASQRASWPSMDISRSMFCL